MHPSDPDWPLCNCGCGEPVPVRKASVPSKGYRVGDPCKYVAGHFNRARIKLPVNGKLKCPKCGETKFLTEFHVDSTRPSGRCPWCKDCQAAKARVHYQKHKVRLDAQIAAYRAQNPGVVPAAQSRYRKKPEYALEARRYASAYRARKRDAFVEHVDPMVVFERDAGVCGICGVPIVGAFHVDHIVPLARGGEHSYANSQAAHPSCNSSKKDKLHGPTDLRALH